jgi:DNA-binding LytR/AlgR family response regulator
MVVDDEPLAREVLGRFIGREPSLQLVAECGNGLEALAVLRQRPVDLLFLDIQMPELLGTELIRILRNPPKVILTTAYPEFALEGYELDVVDYLLKPIQFERFLKAVHKAVAGFALAGAVGTAGAAPMASSAPAERQSEGWLYFRTDRKMVKVMLDDILYIEGMKNYIKIITTRGLVITKYSMAAVEAMLPASGFLRTHRSYIVSLTKIGSYTGESIGIGNVEIPIGKLYKSGVIAALSRNERFK